jgi:hypothetical protein
MVPNGCTMVVRLVLMIRDLIAGTPANREKPRAKYGVRRNRAEATLAQNLHSCP